VCINADESEPATFNNRLLMELDPHQFLEGILIACFATKAATAYIYVRFEYIHAFHILERAIAEARQALENIELILQARGLGLEHLLRCTVMLADMGEWAAMNRVYIEHFSMDLPARSAFGVSGLALGGRVEIECFATVG